MGEPSDRRLGPYRLINQLAVGGMAEIYSATAAGVGGFEKLVALKVIHPNFSEDPEFVQMLVDEAKLAVQLQHANIVQTFDLGCIDNQYYIAMEMIDGIDLYRLLRRASEKEIDFPFEVAAFVAMETAQGLDYAHRKRDERGRPLEIVHRDISPQNILVSYEGEVKIVDFGIAKAARRAKQTAAGVIKGKYYYMSPEQAWGDPIDARTDIFSTGILLYEMLVGQMLYLEEDMDVLLEKVRKAQIPKPSTKRKGVPVQLETLVMKALSKRPQERFQSAGEMATSLARFLRARAPDFNRSKLAAWVLKVLGSDPTDRHQARDPRLSTAVRRAEIERDQNSLLFRLAELQAEADNQPKTDRQPVAQKKAAPSKPAPARKPAAPAKPANVPAPRTKDQATSPVKMPELLSSFANDYEENDATIVDGMNETLMAAVPDSELFDHEESTRPIQPSSQLKGIRRPLDSPDDTSFDEEEELDSTDQLLDDPLASLGDENETKADRTSQERVRRMKKPAPRRAPAPEPRLPGVRSPPPQADKPLYGDSGPLTDEDGDTSERLQRKSSPDDEETAVVDSREKEAVPRAAPPQPTAPMTSSPRPSQQQPILRPSQQQPTIAMGAMQPESPHTPTAAPWPPGSGLPLPSGLPVLQGSGFTPPHGQPNAGAQAQAHAQAHAQAQGWSAKFSTDAVVKSLQPRNSRVVLLVIGAVMLIAALVAVLSSGPATPPKGSIEVVSSPAGAEVKIDRMAIAQATPLVITDVDPARPHHVSVGKKGYDSWESDVKFDGDTRQVRLQAILVPVVASLEISSTPEGAEAIVNGRIAGTTPTTVSELSPNDDVVVELRLRGYRVARKSLSFAGKRKLEVSIPLEKAR